MFEAEKRNLAIRPINSHYVDAVNNSSEEIETERY